MVELTESERRVLRAVTSGAGAAALYEATDADPARLGELLVGEGVMLLRVDADAIAGAEVVDGLLAGPWPWLVAFAGGVTLTPYGAAMMKVAIVELSAARWAWDDADHAEAEPPDPWVDRHMHGYRMPCPELVPDHRPGPAEEVTYLMDEFSGTKVMLFAGGGEGIPVVIDRRLGKPRRAG